MVELPIARSSMCRYLLVDELVDWAWILASVCYRSRDNVPMHGVCNLTVVCKAFPRRNSMLRLSMLRI